MDASHEWMALLLQVHLWRLPQLCRHTASSAELVGSVDALPAVQPFDAATGSLVWTELPGGVSSGAYSSSCPTSSLGKRSSY